MAMTTQYLLPELADKMCTQLKPVWFFSEAFLFVLTGCVIRPAIDSGIVAPLFGNFLALLLVGSLARMLGDVVACTAWQWRLLGVSPAAWTRAQWGDLARRVAFVWVATTPKATLQGTLGPKVAKTFAKAAHHDASYLGPSVFIAPAAAVSILYCATLGTLLTFTAGRVLAVYFQEKLDAATGSIEEAVAAPLPPGTLAAVNHPSSVADVSLQLQHSPTMAPKNKKDLARSYGIPIYTAEDAPDAPSEAAAVTAAVPAASDEVR
jgi:hypothetical protein